MAVKITDTHVHIWDFDRAEYEWLKNDTSLLHRNYAVWELEAGRLKAGVTAGVLVQAANNRDDTDWMLHVAARTSWIKAVVGWLPLLQPAAAARALAVRYADNPYLKGIRHLVHDEPDTRWLLQEPVLESLRMLADQGLTYDMVGVMPAHIETALQVAEKVPGLRIEFDHLNQPPIAARERFGRWGSLMKAASEHPSFFVKISGLGTASGNPRAWTADDIRPYIEFVLAHFGTERAMCGGDWPVSLLAGSYTDTWRRYHEAIDTLLDEAGREQVYWKTAEDFYRL